MPQPTHHQCGPAAGVSMDAWEHVKKQNLSTQVSPLFGFKLDNFVDETLQPYVDELERYSQEVYDRIDAMSAEEFFNGLSDLRKEVSANEAVARLLSQEELVSLYSIYVDFFTENGGSLDD